MRLARVIGITSVALLAGCHPSPPKSATPTDVVTLFKDIQAKFAAIPTPDPKVTYDLRTPEGLASLKTALQPYNAALDEAKAVLTFHDYPQPFMSVAEFDHKKLVPGSKNDQDLKFAAFVKHLIKALSSRARLEYSNGQTAKGLDDLKVAAQTIQLLSSKQGSLLAVLVIIATKELLLRYIQDLSLDTVLDKKEYDDLAPVAASLGKPALFAALLHDEQAWSAQDKSAPSPKEKRDADTLRSLLVLFSQESRGSVEMLSKVKAIAGNRPAPTTVEDISNASFAVNFLSIYAANLHGVAEARMTTAFARALAEKDQTGSFPKSFPAHGDEALDPFNGKPLSYRFQGGGFTIDALGSRGFVPSPAFGDTYHITYPMPKYLHAAL